MYVCMYVCMYVYSFEQVHDIHLFLNKMFVFWHLLTLFRSVAQNIIIHTDNYIKRNGTKREYIQFPASYKNKKKK